MTYVKPLSINLYHSMTPQHTYATQSMTNVMQQTIQYIAKG